ncbi:hypothetical protein B0J14DRAFT_688614 [Halenospora varia]|nr:hypothetical protein B0J14DRAFT_688614 [Halenospora varia]
MYITDLLTLLLAATPLVLANPIVQQRDEDRPNEAVFLVHCDVYQKGQDQSPNGRRDKLWYYKDYKDSQNNGVQTDEDFASNSGDKSKHVEWASGTMDNPIKGIVDKRNSRCGAEMRCYDNAKSSWKQDFGAKMYQICSAKYYCTRKERKIRRTQVTIYSTIETVQITGHQYSDMNDIKVQADVREAYASLKQHMKANAADGAGYKIGDSNWEIQYTVNRPEKKGDPYFEEDKINQISDMLAKQMYPELMKNDKITGISKTPVKPGSSGKGVALATHNIPFPKEIKVVVQIADQAVLSWDDRDSVVAKVVNKNAKGCSTDKASSLALKAVFSAVSAVATGGYSALATGLGAVAGEVDAGFC